MPTYTYAYSPAPGTSAGNRDQVRVLVGDRAPSAAAGSMADEEIAALLLQRAAVADTTLADCYAVAIQACMMRAAASADTADTRILGTAVSGSQRSKAWTAMADRLRAAMAELGLVVPLELSFGAETSVAAMATQAQDTDRPTPLFQPGDHDYPGVTGQRPTPSWPL